MLTIVVAMRSFTAFSRSVNEHEMLRCGKLAHMAHEDEHRDYEENTTEKLMLQHGPRVHGVTHEVNV